MTALRDRLRTIPSVTGTPPPGFTLSTAPPSPIDLFIVWLTEAIDGGLVEPAACTLSTVSEGQPDVRVLILKDVTTAGFEIATSASSPKAHQLGADPRCALSFHWTGHARAVRVRGTAVRASEAEARADFAARNRGAQAVALVGKQSQVVGDADVQGEIGRARERIEEEPDVDAAWSVWRVVPAEIEFWQGSPDRNHLRVRYRDVDGGWVREQLWA